MSPNTSVVNSRPHKKLPIVWRRRLCKSCENVFTTDEVPRVAANKLVASSKGRRQLYNPGMLLLSVAESFRHNPQHGTEVAWDITNTITTKLSVTDGTLTTQVIKDVTYDTLLHFDPIAATQYALHHGIEITRLARKRP